MRGPPYPGRHHAARDHTHALFRTASHSFLDNIVAFLSQTGAWNSSQETPADRASPRELVAMGGDWIGDRLGAAPTLNPGRHEVGWAGLRETSPAVLTSP